MKQITFTAFDESLNRTYTQVFLAKDANEAIEFQKDFENDIPFDNYHVEPDFIAEGEDSLEELFELEENAEDA